MKAFPIFFVFLLAVDVLAEPPLTLESITTTKGKVYTHVKITQIEPSGIKIYHDSGVARVFFEEMSPDVQKLFNYDAVASASHKAKLAADNLTAQKAIATEKDRVNRLQNKSAISSPAGALKETLKGLEQIKERLDQKNREQEQYKNEIIAAVETVHGWTDGQLPDKDIKAAVDVVVKSKTDKFNGGTTLELVMPFAFKARADENSLPLFDGEIELDVNAFFAGEFSLSSSIRITRIAKGWRWMKFHTVFFLIDGYRWTPEAEISTDVFDGGSVYESIAINLDEDNAARFMNAKQVDLKIGTIELPWKNGHTGAVKAVIMAQRLKKGWSMTNQSADKNPGLDEKARQVPK
jgi:hypothetical protein